MKWFYMISHPFMSTAQPKDPSRHPPWLHDIMARTRGLGRAIGRLVGRDRHDDHDAADVPERSRPTALARTQRVQHMIAEGRDMAEDVADMTDDVPVLAAEAPEMHADIEGADGAEGSDADDAAEGFPGGPRDSSVLTSFAEHVAHAVWSEQERPDLKLMSHGRKVTLIGRLVPEIEGLVAATGLSPLIDCSVITGDPGLISAFVERWNGETSTFHLPVGDLTITLDDVSSLLHLPITGALHSFHAFSTEEARFLLTGLLEVSTEEARAETTLTRGAYCWIYEHFPSVHQCVTDDTYQETSPRASRWLTSKAHMKRITGAPYRARCDGLTVTDVSWLLYTEHRGVRAFQEISSFQGQLRWGPMVVTARPERVSIPPPPVGARLSHDEIDDRWMQFAEHLLPAGQLCLVPEQDDYDGYEAIAQRLERVLNLRIVTADTELYDIMQDCLTIVRRGSSADGTVRARQRRCMDH
ncbi:Protein MAIN-LIKE 1 [Glycine max]|nr:Protein MAIN-LIKE 1 [Glycine max]